MSVYTILGQDTDELAWNVLGEEEAASAEQAVRQWVPKRGGSYSVFLAIPERSWKPIRVERVETVQFKVAPAEETARPAAQTSSGGATGPTGKEA